MSPLVFIPQHHHLQHIVAKFILTRVNLFETISYALASAIDCDGESVADPSFIPRCRD